MPEPDAVRDLLIEHSDHQAVRNVYGDYTGGGTATLADYVEAMRATDGALAVVAADGAGEVYARWAGRAGRYEHLSLWPPWTVGGIDYTDGDGLVEYLASKEEVRPTLHDLTPFAGEEPLGDPSGRTWP